MRKGTKKSKRESGTIRMHARGFGFVQLENGSSADIFIPKHQTQNAVDGDTVEVEVRPSDKGPEGRVTAILKRNRTHVAGTIQEIDRFGDGIAHVPLLGTKERVTVEGSPLAVGDRIIMKVLEWGSNGSETRCVLSHHIGHISDPSCDITAAIEEFDLHGEFSQEALTEALAFGTEVSAVALAEREDLREVTAITIDPDTAKDFDDALSLNVDARGHYHLGVHIADVSHYVKSGSALDIEARKRANSTYFPNFCLPMLPAALSNNLCSLQPNVDRLAISTLMEFNADGELVDYRITRSVIRSKKRFTYRDAYAIIRGKRRSRHAAMLKQMVALCELLKRKRCDRGSIDLALPELVVIVDELGAPTHTDLVEYDITHQLVEEFMLKNNELVARHLDIANKNLAFRVHDEPTADNMKDFAALARACGFDLPDAPTIQELQTLFDAAVTTPFGQHLASSYIRRMRMAYYTPDNIGHYGLSLTHYCHFTSPIRRYADLVVHRILFGDSDDYEALSTTTLHCSDQERLSARAENHVRLLKKLRLLKALEEEEPQREYDAVITEIKSFGLVVEILGLMLDGFIHVSELGDDYYAFEERKRRFVGQDTGTILALGDSVVVTLKSVNLVTIESRWQLAFEEVTVNKKKRRKR